MRKMPTLFVRDWDGNPKYVTRRPNPECSWVFAGAGTPTVKWDGTCCMVDESGDWWARREVKPGKTPPPNFVEISVDDETGKVMGWEPIGQSAFAKFHAEVVDRAKAEVERMGEGWQFDGWEPGTYELIGPKINGNPQDWPHHELIRHGHADTIRAEDVKTAPRDFDGLAVWLHAHPYEGIVWHGPDGRMAKLKKRDFVKPEATR